MPRKNCGSADVLSQSHSQLPSFSDGPESIGKKREFGERGSDLPPETQPICE
jgi:hypothetical protein